MKRKHRQKVSLMPRLKSTVLEYPCCR